MSKYPHEPGFQDRETSRQAALDFRRPAKTLREAVYRTLAEKPATTHEVAEMLGKTVPSVQPRLSELAAQGKIGDTGYRKLNKSGKSAIVWKVI